MMEVMCVKHYMRYADDMVILAATKEELHQLLAEIRNYFKTYLNLELKGNYQIYPVAKRGIDTVGYVHYHTHVLVRKTIKKSFCKAVKKNKPAASIASYMGWLKHCDSKHLIKKINGKKVQ